MSHLNVLNIFKEYKMNKSIGGYFLFLATALYLLATGILGLADKKIFKDGGEIRNAVAALSIKGNLAETLIVIFSILAIAAGAFILLKFFGIEIPMTELLLVVLAIFWLVFIIMFDIVNPLSSNKNVVFVDWMRGIGSHLMVLGALLLATERFGG